LASKKQTKTTKLRSFHARRRLKAFISDDLRYFSAPMPRKFLLLLFFFAAGTLHAQIQVELKLKRLQYIAYEPIVATLNITNMAGRNVELRDPRGQHWFGFEVTGSEDRPIAPGAQDTPEPSLQVASGQTITRKFNLTPVYPIHDLGTYHVRANVYFADFDKYFYSRPQVFQITNARPVWEKKVGLPEGTPGAGRVRSYSLLTNRFADHSSLYVRVEDKDNGVVYATYPLGRLMSYDDPQAKIDRLNQLHVLHCAAPRTWTYSHVGLNGQLLRHETFLETKSRPHLRRTSNGEVAVAGGMRDLPVTASAGPATPKLSARPADVPGGGQE
jgi:hypothetical protein